MSGESWLNAEVANLHSRVQEIDRLLLANVRHQSETTKLIQLDPNKVTRSMYDSLVKRIEEDEAHTSRLGQAVKAARDTIDRIRGMMEGVASDMSDLMVKVDELADRVNG